MNYYINKFINYGVDSGADTEERKRIRIYNLFLIGQVASIVIAVPIMVLSNFNVKNILVFSPAYIGVLIPVTLNLFKKNYLSRLVNIVVSCLAISIVSIFFGPEIHVHYYLLVAAAFPFLWLPRQNKLRYIFCGIAILNWLLLVGYYSTFGGDYPLKVGNSDFIKFINDLAIIIFMISLFYITTREYNNELEKVKLKSRQIEEKNISLERFSFIASHDLKEPLRTVQSFNEVIKEEFEEHLNDDLTSYFKFIDNALVRMKAMIDGLLLYSKIGKSNVASNVDLNVVIQDLKSDLSNLISSNNVTIKHKNMPTIVGGEIELRLLFQNLIANAVKFQQPGKKPIVEITFENQPNFWQFCIADNGIGVEEKKYQEIFNIFTKLHPTTKFEGHGLGLAFCKKIVEAHKGKIWVESMPNEGSKFYFTISKDSEIEKED